MNMHRHYLPYLHNTTGLSCHSDVWSYMIQFTGWERDFSSCFHAEQAHSVRKSMWHELGAQHRSVLA